MTISTDTINLITNKFLQAEDNHQPITQVTSLYPEITVPEAYKVQQAIVAQLQERGHKVIGKKGGFTNVKAQQGMGLAEAVYGRLFDFHQVAYGETISTAHLIHPMLECEIAFVLGQPLSGSNIQPADVLAATESVVASFEIVDFRIRDWKISKYEAVAYNVFARYFVLGEQPMPVSELDLPSLTVKLTKNGVEAATGSGAAVLDNPANSVAWLANKLTQHGPKLEAGEIIMAGSTTPLQPVMAGDYFEAEFEKLGTIGLQFE